VWLPDRRIAFSRGIGPFDAPNDSFHSPVLYTARSDGTDVRRPSQPGVDGVCEDLYSRLSPAGYLVFQRRRDDDGSVALYRMDHLVGAVTQLVDFALNAEQFDVSPARWGPTRDLVVFDTFVDGQTSLGVATVPATCISLADCTGRTRFLTTTPAARGATPTRASRPTGGLDRVHRPVQPHRRERRHLDHALRRHPPAPGVDGP
jgi:hypothetical protein